MTQEDKMTEPVDRSKRCTVGEAIAPGVPNTETGPDGQQRGYVILCDEERAKGFVRPVRRTYWHVGRRPRFETRPLTPEENARHNYSGDGSCAPSLTGCGMGSG